MDSFFGSSAWSSRPSSATTDSSCHCKPIEFPFLSSWYQRCASMDVLTDALLRFSHIKAECVQSHYNQSKIGCITLQSTTGTMATILSEYIIVCCSCCDMFVLALTYFLYALQIHPSSTCDLVAFCFFLLSNNHHDDQLRPSTDDQHSKCLVTIHSEIIIEST